MKTVLITGAGRGLGRAISEVYYNDGFEVIATDIDLTLLSDISNKEGFTCIKLDVTSEKGTRKCAAYVEEKFGRLDILISNAGIFNFYPISEAGTEKLKEIFDVNVFGLTNLTKYFLPLLIKSKGRLIVIGSESYKVPSPFQPYAVSKQALEKVFNSIQLELMNKGIKSILIRPGAIQTKIMEDTIKLENPTSNSVFESEFENFRRSVPKYIGKVLEPEHVAKVILKAGRAKRPKHIYNINHNLIVAIISMLPKRLKEKLVVYSLTK